MEIIVPIQCKGCGATGKATWDVRALQDGVRPTGPPLAVSGEFRFHEARHQGPGRIACNRCQQFVVPG